MDIQKMVAAYQTMGKTLRITVNGDSMRPIMNSGDKLWIYFAKRTPRLGEIVLFSTKDGYVIHRVVKCLKSGGLITKGDGNYMWDSIVVSEADVVGFAETQCRSHILMMFASHLSYCEGKWNDLAYHGRRCMRRPRLMLGSFFRFVYQQMLKCIQSPI